MDLRHARKWFISCPLHTTIQWSMQWWQRHCLIMLLGKKLFLKFLWIDQYFYFLFVLQRLVFSNYSTFEMHLPMHCFLQGFFFSTSCTGSESDIVRQKATMTLSKKYEVAEIQYTQHSRWKNGMEKDSQINCQLRKITGVNTRCMHGIIYPGTCTTELGIVLEQLLYFLKEWDIIIRKGHKGKGVSLIFSKHIKSVS